MGSLRKKILRKPGGVNYPFHICVPCGTYAAGDCNTVVQEYLETTLGTCGVCRNIKVPVADPYDFGWPTFYTYENGAPVRGGN